MKKILIIYALIDSISMIEYKTSFIIGKNFTRMLTTYFFFIFLLLIALLSLPVTLTRVFSLSSFLGLNQRRYIIGRIPKLFTISIAINQPFCPFLAELHKPKLFQIKSHITNITRE